EPRVASPPPRHRARRPAIRLPQRGGRAVSGGGFSWSGVRSVPDCRRSGHAHLSARRAEETGRRAARPVRRSPGTLAGHGPRGQNLLLARRLVEAGVPFVNVYDYKQQGKNWDAHVKNFKLHKDQLLPAADQALSALIEDLDARGLLASTLVVALGEFGRTPRI